MAGKVVGAIEAALGALKTDEADHTSRLKAVERYGDVLALAQGKLVEKPVDEGCPQQFTWEEFSAMYARRRVETPTSEHVPHPDIE